MAIKPTPNPLREGAANKAHELHRMLVGEDALRGLCETATRLAFGAEDTSEHLPRELVEQALLDAASAHDELVAWVKAEMPRILTLGDLQQFALQARSVRAKLALFHRLAEAPS